MKLLSLLKRPKQPACLASAISLLSAILVDHYNAPNKETSKDVFTIHGGCKGPFKSGR